MTNKFFFTNVCLLLLGYLTGIEGHVGVDHNGDRRPNFVLRNYVSGSYVTVAHYSQA